MKRRPATPSVTLFPFLAVLVCTMGALILLLLVTTRQIRNQARLAAQTPALASEMEDEPAAPSGESDLPPSLIISDAEPAPPPPPKVDWDAEHRRLNEEYERALRLRQEEQAKLDEDWQRRVALLTAEQERLQQQLAALRPHTDAEAAELEQLRAELQRLKTLLANAKEQQMELMQLERQFGEQQQQLREQAGLLGQMIDSSRAASRQRSRQLRIAAVDPTTGTERKPILIECRENGLIFASEQVAISATELSGFTPDYNPLRAGCEALVEHFSKLENRAPGDFSKPYLLLVVRPGGTIGFYVARKLLEKMEHDFGYELVQEQDEFDWPESDPEATRVCREAVERMLAERERLAARVRGGRYPVSGPLMFAGTDGRFHLQEVEELRNTEDAIYIGGQKWAPPKRNRPTDPGGFAPSPAGGGAADRGGPPTGMSGTGGSGASAPRRLIPADAAAIDDSASGSGRHPLLSDPVPPAPEPRQLSTTTLPGYPAQPQAAEFEPTGRLQSGRPIPESADSGKQMTPGRDGSERPGETASAASRLANGSASSSSGSPFSSTTPPSTVGNMPSPLDLTPPRGKVQEKDDGKNRRWGESQRNGNIGIEREVTVHIWPNRVIVDDELSIDVPADMSRSELQHLFGHALNSHVRSWGPAPEYFFWKPALKFAIHPGGHQHHSRLNELADHWGLRKSVEHVLD